MRAMTTREVKQMIDETGLPNAYHHFREGTGREPPFVVFYFPDSVDFMADGINYAKRRRLIIELYTDAKDFASEAVIEGVLTAHGQPYEMAEAYIEGEQMYMAAYTTEVYINEEE